MPAEENKEADPKTETKQPSTKKVRKHIKLKNHKKITKKFFKHIYQNRCDNLKSAVNVAYKILWVCLA